MMLIKCLDPYIFTSTQTSLFSHLKNKSNQVGFICILRFSNKGIQSALDNFKATCIYRDLVGFYVKGTYVYRDFCLLSLCFPVFMSKPPSSMTFQPKCGFHCRLCSSIHLCKQSGPAVDHDLFGSG